MNFRMSAYVVESEHAHRRERLRRQSTVRRLYAGTPRHRETRGGGLPVEH